MFTKTSCDARNLSGSAICGSVYLRYDVHIHTARQTDRQTRITFNTSVWGSLRLAPISACVTSFSVVLAPALQPLLEFHFDSAYKGHSHLAKLPAPRSVPLALDIIAQQQLL